MSNATVANWWEQRLRERNPLALSSTIGWDYRPRTGMHAQDSWPHSVARMSLYQDYTKWCEEQEILRVEAELLFFLVMKPWLYLRDKNWHVRNYFVRQQEPFEGGWLTLKKRRYFVRLLTWEEHVDAFQNDTGRVVLQEHRASYVPT
jgi:hypothetical protein